MRGSPIPHRSAGRDTEAGCSPINWRRERPGKCSLFRSDARSIGGSYCNFGQLVRNSGQPGESLEWFEKAIRILTAVHEQNRGLVMARQYLRNSHSNRAQAYDRLRNFAEAIKNWDKAIELSPEEEQAGFRAATRQIAARSRSGGAGRGGVRRTDEERIR